MQSIVSLSMMVSLLVTVPGLAYMGESMLPVRPAFETDTINITAVAGLTTTLPCAIEHKGDFTVIWLNPRKTLISKDDVRNIDDSRMSVERPKIRDWNLLIREVRYNDSGEYMCQINTKPVLIKRINLYVKVSPEIIEDFTPASFEVVEGTTVELICNASGVPYPMVTWLRQTNDPSYSVSDYGEPDLIGEVLILRNITRYCEGEYTCEASNGISPTAMKTFQVSILFPPEVRLLVTRIGQVLGKETMLECKISASPHGSIMWKKNGSEVSTQSYRYWTEIFDDSPHEKSLVLSIIDIEQRDYGYYTCEASNSQGYDSESMLLYEYIQVYKDKTPTTTLSPSPPTTPVMRLMPGNRWEPTDIYEGQSKKRPGAPDAAGSVFSNFNSASSRHGACGFVWVLSLAVVTLTHCT